MHLSLATKLLISMIVSVVSSLKTGMLHVRCWVDLIININALDDELNGIKHVEN